MELDLGEKELEPEPELEPEEAEKPEKPSVFLVFRKVGLRPEPPLPVLSLWNLGSPPSLTPRLFLQIWLTALCLVLVFTVTLSVFPAITAMVTSSTSPGKWSE